MSLSLTPLDSTDVPENRPAAADDDHIVAQAISILERRFFAAGCMLSGPDDVCDYLRLKLTQEPNEVFVAIFLTTKHQVIACETLFRGTIDSAEVHPRVVVQRALSLNAAALIVGHQHPSGETQPSAADKEVTAKLKQALAMLDIRLLDHFIIGRGHPFSFAAKGLL